MGINPQFSVHDGGMLGLSEFFGQMMVAGGRDL